MNQANWNNTRVASGDLSEELTRLKQEPGKGILVHGGARFAQLLSGLGLIDEYRSIVHPVALSGGLPLFAQGIDLKLLGARTFPCGTVALEKVAVP